MYLQAQILSEEEQHRIHQQSLRILAEVGVRFHGEKALPLLKANGAKVEEESSVAFLPGGKWWEQGSANGAKVVCARRTQPGY